jgi:hypothetical protein
MLGVAGMLAGAGLSRDQIKVGHPEADRQSQQEQGGADDPGTPPANGYGPGRVGKAGGAFGVLHGEFDNGGLDAGNAAIGQFQSRGQAIAQGQASINLPGGAEARPRPGQRGEDEDRGGEEEG